MGGTGTGRAEGAVILCREGGLKSSMEERGCGEEGGRRKSAAQCAWRAPSLPRARPRRALLTSHSNPS